VTSFLTSARRGKGLVAAATAAFATLATLTFSPTAQAGTPAQAGTTPQAGTQASAPQKLTPASSITFKVPGGNKPYKATVGSAQVQMTSAVAAECRVNAFNPFRYYGGTPGGGVQGIAEIRCDRAVTQLEIEIALFRYNTQVTYNYRTNYSSSFINITTEYYPFSAGNYTTAALGAQLSDGAITPLAQDDSATVYLR
jgi:hypothetical protein